MKSGYIQDFTKGNITSQLIRFSTPLFLSSLLQVVYNMVDMVVELVLGMVLVLGRMLVLLIRRQRHLVRRVLKNHHR